MYCMFFWEKSRFLVILWPKISFLSTLTFHKYHICNFFLHNLLVDTLGPKMKAKIPCYYVRLNFFWTNLDIWSFFDQKLHFFQLWPSTNTASATFCNFWLCQLLEDMFSFKTTIGFPATLCFAPDIYKFVFFNFQPTCFREKFDHFKWV